MMKTITPKNLVRHELIGLRAKVSSSSNKSMIGTAGKVVNETKNMLVLRTARGIRKIGKTTSDFIFTLPDRRKVEVRGKIIEMRPEDRTKMKTRKW